MGHRKNPENGLTREVTGIIEEIVRSEPGFGVVTRAQTRTGEKALPNPAKSWHFTAPVPGPGLRREAIETLNRRHKAFDGLPGPGLRREAIETRPFAFLCRPSGPGTGASPRGD